MNNLLEIAKWGNSLAFRIPQKVAKEIGLDEGSKVTVSVQSGKMVIARSYSLEELCAQITPENNPVFNDWGNPIGKEMVEYDEDSK
jgi:antitoxin MazE